MNNNPRSPLAVLLIVSAAVFLTPVVVAESQDKNGLRFGILSIAPPARIHAKWQPFTYYLSEQLGESVEIVVPRGFGKMKQAVISGDVDFVYINSYVFYVLKQAGEVTGVAQMENVDGNVTSRSEIYVRADSNIDSIDQLKDRRIAFVSPMGAGGFLAPRAYLYSHGVITEEDSQEIFTKNLSNSIHQVLLGDSDAGTMCGVNYRLMSEKLDTGELRILAISDEYPENVVAARTSLPAERIQRVRDAIVGMSQRPDGRQVLASMQSMKVKRFLPYDATLEAMTRALLDQAQLAR